MEDCRSLFVCLAFSQIFRSGLNISRSQEHKQRIEINALQHGTHQPVSTLKKKPLRQYMKTTLAV